MSRYITISAMKLDGKEKSYELCFLITIVFKANKQKECTYTVLKYLGIKQHNFKNISVKVKITQEII